MIVVTAVASRNSPRRGAAHRDTSTPWLPKRNGAPKRPVRSNLETTQAPSSTAPVPATATPSTRFVPIAQPASGIQRASR